MTRPAFLGCGADLDRLTAQVVDRAAPADPEHQAGCPFCRAAIAELRTLWSPVHAVADGHIAVPENLVERVLDQIFDLDYTGGRAVIATDGGQTAIAVQVVGVIARKAADSVNGTLLTISRARSAVEIGAVGRSVVVHVQIVAALGMELPRLAAQIRQAIRAHVTALTGLSVVAVDVSVVEVAEGRPGR